MITITEVLIILFIHWFADFVLQTDKQAKGKSKSWSDLLGHTVTYSLCWIPAVMLMLNWTKNPMSVIGFVIITFVAHTVTDYFTSRLNSRLWAEGKVHNFFVSVGFDQFLHYAQLLITYQLLK